MENEKNEHQGDNDGFDLDAMRRVRATDQTESAAEDLARVTSAYYHALVNQGMPQSIAGTMAKSFQDIILSGKK